MRFAPGLCVCPEHFLYRFQFARFRFSKYVANHHRNLIEGNVTIQERCYGHLVRSIECNRFRTPGLSGFIGQRQTREFFHVRRAELEVP